MTNPEDLEAIADFKNQLVQGRKRTGVSNLELFQFIPPERHGCAFNYIIIGFRKGIHDVDDLCREVCRRARWSSPEGKAFKSHPDLLRTSVQFVIARETLTQEEKNQIQEEQRVISLANSMAGDPVTLAQRWSLEQHGIDCSGMNKGSAFLTIHEFKSNKKKGGSNHA